MLVVNYLLFKVAISEGTDQNYFTYDHASLKLEM